MRDDRVTIEFPTELPHEEVEEPSPRRIVRRVAVLVEKTVYSDGWVDYDTEVVGEEGEDLETVEDTEVLGLLHYAHLKMEAVLIQGMRLASAKGE